MASPAPRVEAIRPTPARFRLWRVASILLDGPLWFSKIVGRSIRSDVAADDVRSSASRDGWHPIFGLTPQPGMSEARPSVPFEPMGKGIPMIDDRAAIQFY